MAPRREQLETPAEPSAALHYYEYPPAAPASPTSAPDRLRILWVTSLRDVGAEDRNGVRVSVPEGDFYMMGLLEALVRRINGESLRRHFLAPDLARVGGRPSPDPTSSDDWLKSLRMLGVIDGDSFCRDRVELAGIVIDDTEDDLAHGRLGGYGPIPDAGRPWIAPESLAVRGDGGPRPLAGLVRRIPSAFRHLPPGDPRRPAEKEAFEARLAAVFRETGANLIVLDHAMFIVDALLRVHGLGGRILNIHPGITDPSHPDASVGSTPTVRSLDRARRVGRPVTTGATLHLVDEGIDTGPRLLVGDLTNVYAEDDPVRLRLRNYSAKLLVFFLGLRHYGENVRLHAGDSRVALDGLRAVRRLVPFDEVRA